MDVALYLNIVSTIAAVVAALYAVVTYHRPKGDASIMSKEGSPARGAIISRLVIFVLSGIIIAQVFFNYYEKNSATVEPILSWGTHKISSESFAYTMIVNGHSYLEYKDQYHLTLILRVPFADINEMSDTAIEKSALYDITDEPIAPAHISENKLHLTPMPGTNTALIKYILIALPDKIGVDAVTSLGNLQSLGGKILTDRSQTILVELKRTLPSAN